MAEIRKCDVCGKVVPLDRRYPELPEEGWFRVSGCTRTGGFSNYPRHDVCSSQCLSVLGACLVNDAPPEIPTEGDRIEEVPLG